jgi:long-chain fatty acid transport protein
MKKILTALGALALTTTAATAGGFDRSGQPIGWLFEKGNYAEVSFGLAAPSVSGTQMVAFGGPFVAGANSGNMAPSYIQLGFAMKMDVNEKLSLGLQLDPTYGADVAYPAATGYLLGGTTASLRGDSIVLAARYKINENFSVHGGLRNVGIGGGVTIVRAGTPIYMANFNTDRSNGFLIGAAYEKPEIAMRVALTYFSETNHDMVTNVPTAPDTVASVELPKSVALDFQTGVAANTLVFGQVRWSNWTATELNAPFYPANPLIGYENNTVSYSLGVGRKFNDQWSGAVTVGYEEPKGGLAMNLAPTDGTLSVGLGATYTKDNIKITTGLRYVQIGDAVALGGAGAFNGNSALGIGFKVGYTF